MIRKLFLWLILWLILFISGQAQSALQIKQYGDESFQSKNYYSAILYYEAVKAIEPSWTDVAYNLADCYRLVFSYEQAEKAYLDVLNLGWDKYPQSAFWAAMMMKSNGKYEQAKEMFHKYIARGIFSEEYCSVERASIEISACDSSLFWITHPIDAGIENMKTINSPYSEFNPVSIGDSILVFSALRPLVDSDNPLLATGDFLSQIYQANYGMVGLEQAVPIHQNINSKDQHTANITFTDDGKRAYFNRCSYSNNSLRCDLWVTEWDKGSWLKARKLPSPINDNSYTVTQPFVAFDTVSKNDVIYFSSDRPGGMGGLDIWFCIVKNGVPQQPVNLGSMINTPGDEITPFYSAKENKLFFSSDRHTGMGGFDVFFALGNLSSWTKPENMKFPINSGANDFFFFKGSGDESYLTSNRPGSMTFKQQTCCNDIFLVKLSDTTAENVVVNIDTIETGIRNDILELLPMSLYFDNDHPDPRSSSSTTNLTYEETWIAYMKQKQKFVDEYAKGLEGYAMYYAIAEMEDFFVNEVDKNYTKLLILTELLYQDVLGGSNVTLKVKGFTSPLTSTEYNIVLARRRIQSLINYFTTWNGGVLVPYMNGTASNGASFRIFEEPAGEVLSDPYVSDNPHDRQKSVYSKSASMERRIQIMVYESDFKKFVNLNDNQPMIYIEDNVIQLDESNRPAGSEIYVSLKNIGTEPLKIFEIQSSSSFIRISKGVQVIEPNQSATVVLVVVENLPNPFTAHIIVISNSPEERNVIYFSTATGSK